MKFNILVVNPKERVTQVAVYNNYKLLYINNRYLTTDELAGLRRFTTSLISANRSF